MDEPVILSRREDALGGRGQVSADASGKALKDVMD